MLQTLWKSTPRAPKRSTHLISNSRVLILMKWLHCQPTARSTMSFKITLSIPEDRHITQITRSPISSELSAEERRPALTRLHLLALLETDDFCGMDHVQPISVVFWVKDFVLPLLKRQSLTPPLLIAHRSWLIHRPVSGYMFGKGIYLADMSSKSANYWWVDCASYHSALFRKNATLENRFHSYAPCSSLAVPILKLRLQLIYWHQQKCRWYLWRPCPFTPLRDRARWPYANFDQCVLHCRRRRKGQRHALNVSHWNSPLCINVQHDCMRPSALSNSYPSSYFPSHWHWLCRWGQGTTGPTAWKDGESIHPSLKGVKLVSQNILRLSLNCRLWRSSSLIRPRPSLEELMFRMLVSSITST